MLSQKHFDVQKHTFYTIQCIEISKKGKRRRRRRRGAISRPRTSTTPPSSAASSTGQPRRPRPPRPPMTTWQGTLPEESNSRRAPPAPTNPSGIDYVVRPLCTHTPCYQKVQLTFFPLPVQELPSQGRRSLSRPTAATAATAAAQMSEAEAAAATTATAGTAT